ncbi:CHASE3 domain-containing protein [Tianweitania sp. BSSL-BM11]|uniref:histidine kinase n=1 Tax=Tianweitania aestuarii TaxID=2814886 RepID=A0ABS5RSJ7_9HYPH|nr:ATP-binding protein [Tianweitania aestuarii]MBS9720024.1 CHASE3 domain-containing protein [Tianweitania aestuarii]
MSTSRARFMRSAALFLLIGLAALLAIVGATFWLAQRSEAISDTLTQWRITRAATVNLRNSIQIVESSQRGFLLTDDPQYLEPYEQEVGRIAPLYGRLAATVQPLLGDRVDVGRFDAAITAKLAEIADTIQLAQSGRREEAIARVRTNVGKELMEEADAFFAETIEAADEQSLQGLTSQARNFSALRLVTLIGGGIILLVVGGSVWTAIIYTREIMQARAEVEAMNVGLESRIQERTQDLLRANEEVQRFAYIVTHDLRAPLVNIMGFTAELDTTMKTIQNYVLAEPGKATESDAKEAKLAAEEDLPEAIGFIRSSTKKMDGLINAILKISREGRRPLKPEPIDLKTMLENTLASVQHQIVEDNGEATIDVAVPRIVSDRMSLEQIVGNLLDNAVKYSAKDRALRLRLKAERKPGNRFTLSVEDNGRGIAEQDHERVFDLFRRAGTQDKAGEGIGLAHVRTLTRSLGGDISVESEFGRGSTFTIELPLDLRTVVRSEV